MLKSRKFSFAEMLGTTGFVALLITFQMELLILAGMFFGIVTAFANVVMILVVPGAIAFGATFIQLCRLVIIAHF
jgi:hypothetical protein